MDKELEIFNNRKVLITGGGGYLGSHLAAKIAENHKAQIFLLDLKFEESQKQNSRFSLAEINLCNKSDVEEFVFGVKPDYVFHFAALLDRKRDFALFDKIRAVNVDGTLNLLCSLRNSGCRNFLFSSTSEIYGSNQAPFIETQHPFPVSPYSLTKLMAESLIKTFSDLYAIPFTVMRIFNFFGPNMPDETFFGQMCLAYRNGEVLKMTKGEQKRDFLYIDDLLNRIVYLADKSKQKYNLYNLCSGKSLSIIEIAQMFHKITDGKFQFSTELDYRPNEIWDTSRSDERFRELGFNLKTTDFEDQLRRMII